MPPDGPADVVVVVTDAETSPDAMNGESPDTVRQEAAAALGEGDQRGVIDATRTLDQQVHGGRGDPVSRDQMDWSTWSTRSGP